MELEFKTDLKAKDMYRFNMYHTYTSAGGLLTFAISIAIFVLVFAEWGKAAATSKVIYLFIAIFVLVYYPVRFYIKSNTLIKTTVLGKRLVYSVGEDGIQVSIPELEADKSQEMDEGREADEDQEVNASQNEKNKLFYEDIYSVRQSKHNLLIYSSRVNAFVIPLEELEGKYDKLATILREKVPAHKLCKQIKNV